MNTGIQRSNSTPRYASTTTSAVGQYSSGKRQNKKDLTQVMAAHNLPYVAQTTFTKNFKDFYEKAEKAIYTQGACFLNVMAPCPRGWRYDSSDIAKICELEVETCVWPLYEVENGVWKLTYMPKEKLPVTEYLRMQGRFMHLFKPENEELLEEIQAEVDRKWSALLNRCGSTSDKK